MELRKKLGETASWKHVESECRHTDMLKLLMKAVFGSSTSKEISREMFPLFRAVEAMTVRAKRDLTVQSTVKLCTST